MPDHLLSCGCLPNGANAHRVSCPEWTLIDPYAPADQRVWRRYGPCEIDGCDIPDGYAECRVRHAEAMGA